MKVRQLACDEAGNMCESLSHGNRNDDALSTGDATTSWVGEALAAGAYTRPLLSSI
jgi:hypothetical protein